ncbi:hypothetical protein [Vibrio crassostreae]|uniref:hypothetical protein n=1 Tax=Vibrio crassostreae TaxID=246167 RepID=UPI001B310407|nr:hypothetical protein [Vibrio crassostreae]
MQPYATTHEDIPVFITTNKKWWQFWKPTQIKIMVRATVNRDLGVAIAATDSNY